MYLMPDKMAVWKILTTLVPSDALTKKKGSLFLAAKPKDFVVTDKSTSILLATTMVGMPLQ